jgi:hypothetical protein
VDSEIDSLPDPYHLPVGVTVLQLSLIPILPMSTESHPLDTVGDGGESVVSASSTSPRKSTSGAGGGRSSDNVRVVCRVRPFNQREMQIQSATTPDEPLRSVVEMGPGTTTLLQPAHNFAPKETFEFDENLWSIPAEQQLPAEPAVTYAAQHTVYERVGAPALAHVVDGWNSCVFAYGQTGGGKTHTMMGPEAALDPASGSSTWAEVGLLPRMCKALFEADWKARSDSVRMTASFYEIYNERIRDLVPLDGIPNPEGLRMSHLKDEGPTVVGLNLIDVKSWPDCLAVIRSGLEHRSVASTKMNDVSSRSHTVFSLDIQQKRAIIAPPHAQSSPSKLSNAGFLSPTSGSAPATHTTPRSPLLPRGPASPPKELIRRSRLSLVDLAGSERVKKSGATGARFLEATAINLSLTTLKNVIDALVEHRPVVPYRDSKLTWLLSQSLGGNSRTFMVVCVSPHRDNWDETLNTLRYAARAQCIVNAPRVNEDTELRRLTLLQDQMAAMKRKIDSTLQDKLDELKADFSRIERKNSSVRHEVTRLGDEIAYVRHKRRLASRATFTAAFAARFHSTIDDRIRHRMSLEMDGLQFALDLESQHLERQAAEAARYVRGARTWKREVAEAAARGDRAKLATAAAESKYNDTGNRIVTLRAEQNRKRSALERLRNTARAAQVVGVIWEVLERGRSRRQIEKEIVVFQAAADTILQHVLGEADAYAAESRERQQAVREANDALRAELESARGAMELRRHYWARRASKVSERLVFEEREGRSAEDASAKALARLDAHWALRREETLQASAAELDALRSSQIEAFKANRSEGELKRAVLAAEMREAVARQQAAVRPDVDEVVTAAAADADRIAREAAILLFMIEQDNEEARAIIDASTGAVYNAYAQDIVSLVALHYDAQALHEALELSPTLRSVVPMAFRLDAPCVSMCDRDDRSGAVEARATRRATPLPQSRGVSPQRSRAVDASHGGAPSSRGRTASSTPQRVASGTPRSSSAPRSATPTTATATRQTLSVYPLQVPAPREGRPVYRPALTTSSRQR